MVDYASVVASVRAGGAVPVLGGMNNRVYRASVDGVPVCCKVYRSGDGRDRDQREWHALQLLRGAECEFAPVPLYREPGIVVMSWVNGSPLGSAALDQRQLSELSSVLAQLYGVRTHDARPCVGPPGVMVDRVRQMHATCPQQSAALSAAGAWLATTEPDRLAGVALDVVGRGDPNLANCLDVGSIALIDWEYSGLTNRAFELADHVEHIGARGTPDHAWATFVDSFELSPLEQTTYVAARRLLAIFFLLLLQPGQKGANVNPPGALRTQEDRVLTLL